MLRGMRTVLLQWKLSILSKFPSPRQSQIMHDRLTFPTAVRSPAFISVVHPELFKCSFSKSHTDGDDSNVKYVKRDLPMDLLPAIRRTTCQEYMLRNCTPVSVREILVIRMDSNPRIDNVCLSVMLTCGPCARIVN